MLGAFAQTLGQGTVEGSDDQVVRVSSVGFSPPASSSSSAAPSSAATATLSHSCSSPALLSDPSLRSDRATSHSTDQDPDAESASQSEAPVEFAIALYDFCDPEGRSHVLSFRKSQVLIITQKVTRQWWLAAAGTRVGLVPSPYVRILSRAQVEHYMAHVQAQSSSPVSSSPVGTAQTSRSSSPTERCDSSSSESSSDSEFASAQTSSATADDDGGTERAKSDSYQDDVAVASKSCIKFGSSSDKLDDVTSGYEAAGNDSLWARQSADDKVHLQTPTVLENATNKHSIATTQATTQATGLAIDRGTPSSPSRGRRPRSSPTSYSSSTPNLPPKLSPRSATLTLSNAQGHSEAPLPSFAAPSSMYGELPPPLYEVPTAVPRVSVRKPPPRPPRPMRNGPPPTVPSRQRRTMSHADISSSDVPRRGTVLQTAQALFSTPESPRGAEAELRGRSLTTSNPLMKERLSKLEGVLSGSIPPRATSRPPVARRSLSTVPTSISQPIVEKALPEDNVRVPSPLHREKPPKEVMSGKEKDKEKKRGRMTWARRRAQTTVTKPSSSKDDLRTSSTPSSPRSSPSTGGREASDPSTPQRFALLNEETVAAAAQRTTLRTANDDDSLLSLLCAKANAHSLAMGAESGQIEAACLETLLAHLCSEAAMGSAAGAADAGAGQPMIRRRTPGEDAPTPTMLDCFLLMHTRYCSTERLCRLLTLLWRSAQQLPDNDPVQRARYRAITDLLKAWIGSYSDLTDRYGQQQEESSQTQRQLIEVYVGQFDPESAQWLLAQLDAITTSAFSDSSPAPSPSPSLSPLPSPAPVASPTASSMSVESGLGTASRKRGKAYEKQLRKEQKKKEASVAQAFPGIRMHHNVTTENTSLLDWSPEEVARQICLIDFALFEKITALELIRWPRVSKEDRSELCSNILAYIQTFNHWHARVSSAILSETDVKRRTAALNHFIATADECRLLNNLSAMMAITSALDSIPISRLRSAWKGVSSTAFACFEELKSLVSPQCSFKKLRQHAQFHPPPLIPHVGIALSDVTFIEDGNPDFVSVNRESTDLINLVKCDYMARVVFGFEFAQRQAYPFDPLPALQLKLKDTSDLLDDDTMYARSKEYSRASKKS